MISQSESNEFVRISDPNSQRFAQFFSIYEESLPASERKSRDAIAMLVERSEYHVIGLLAQSAVIAFAIVFISDEPPFALLEYMATTTTARNAGLGARLFAEVKRIAGMRTLLVEVDSERESSADQEIRRRRKQFYLRQGCQEIAGLAYVMPTVGASVPPMMDMLYCSPLESTPPRVELVRMWLSAIYAGVYDCAPDDPRIESMLQDLVTTVRKIQ